MIELRDRRPVAGRARAELATISDAVATRGRTASSWSRRPGTTAVRSTLLLRIARRSRRGRRAGRTDRCVSFRRAGPRLDVAALGCGMDVAIGPDGQPGIGQSTSLASGVRRRGHLALRSYRPDLTVATVETEPNCCRPAPRQRGPMDASGALPSRRPRRARRRLRRRPVAGATARREPCDRSRVCARAKVCSTAARRRAARWSAAHDPPGPDTARSRPCSFGSRPRAPPHSLEDDSGQSPSQNRR